MTTNYQGKIKGRRKPPYPNSILDRKALTEALEEGGIHVKAVHIDGFYQALHRQHYPPLPQFVENYYANERKEYVQQQQQQQQQQQHEDEKTDKDERDGDTILSSEEGHQNGDSSRHQHESHPSIGTGSCLPLRNSVTNRKNRNKVQLPRTLLEYLASTPDFVHTTSRVAKRLTSGDRSTTKLIVELYDGSVVESVIMRYDKKGSGRASLCVSSQCGCAMGCTFCATGTMGLSGNLTTGEILEQLVHADRILAEDFVLSRQQLQQQQQQQQEQEERPEDEMDEGSPSTTKKIQMVRNVVFMGMGEPLDNYTNVTDACRAMIDRTRWNLAHGRVTVSTVGLIPQIRRLTRELPEVSLALSLHAPNQEARTAIVPTASRYPIEGLIDALDNHMMVYVEKSRGRNRQGRDDSGIDTIVDGGTTTRTAYTKEERMKESSRRRAMIEYVMLEGETSSLECAHQLGRLCEGRQLVVNLIPYNATDVKDVLRCPPEAQVQEFRRIVQSYGTFCTVRRTMGADIASACGQLVQKDRQEDGTDDGTGRQKDLTHEQRTIDIEDVVRDRTVSDNDNENQNLATTIMAGQEEIRYDGSGKVVVDGGTEDQVKGETASKQKDDTSSWMESLSLDDLERWSTVLTAAATISATLFVASSFLYVKRKA